MDQKDFAGAETKTVIVPQGYNDIFATVLVCMPN